jgi:hypothetical protein
LLLTRGRSKCKEVYARTIGYHLTGPSHRQYRIHDRIDLPEISGPDFLDTFGAPGAVGVIDAAGRYYLESDVFAARRDQSKEAIERPEPPCWPISRLAERQISNLEITAETRRSSTWELRRSRDRQVFDSAIS